MTEIPPQEELIEKVKDLQQTLDLYRALIENTQDLFYRTDLEGRISFISPSVYSLSGYTVEEAIGMYMAKEVYLYPEERKDFLAKLRAEGQVTNFEARLKRKDGSVWWASTNAHFYKNREGNILGVEGITRDITMRKALESRLQQAQKMEAIGTLAGGIAHDFNNILGVIFGYTELGLMDTEKDSAAHSYLEEIYIAGERARSLVKQILNFSRQSDQELQPLQLTPVIKEVLKFIQE